MVTNLIRRLGIAGAIVVASALILGALAGGVVVHQVDTAQVGSSDQAQGDESGSQARDKAEKSNGHKNKHANSGHEEAADAKSQETAD